MSHTPLPTVLNDLDLALGAPAVMDLTHRGLLPLASVVNAVSAAVPDPVPDAERARAALLGAAIGNALGRATRYRSPAQIQSSHGRVDNYLPWSGWRSGPVGTFLAEAQLLAAYANALASHGLDASPIFGDELAVLLATLRDPGSAVVQAVARRQQGAPWYSAGPGSFGASALLRGVVDGIAYPADATVRSASAALGAVVTHAHPAAVAGAMVVAQAIGELLTNGKIDDGDLVTRLATECPDADLAARLWNVRGIALQPATEPTVFDVVPSALAYFLRSGSGPEAILAAVNDGGPSHLTAALVGAMVGARHGVGGFDASWVSGLEDADAFDQRAAAIVARHWSTDGVSPTGAGGAVHTVASDDATTVSPTTDGTAGGEVEPAHIWFLLDRSGSMQGMRAAVVDGFNGFVTEQQSSVAPGVLSLAQFDGEDPYETLLDSLPISLVKRLDYDRYVPRGMTPLYDAMASLIDHAEQRVAARVAAGEPSEDQLVLVFTDGEENASRRWTRDGIFARIEACKAKGWTFVFLGANQDSYATGRQIGVADGSVSNYRASDEGMREAWGSVSRAASVYRVKERSQKLVDRDDFFEGLKEAEEAAKQ